jgi:deoxyribodipyrimidine photolyase
MTDQHSKMHAHIDWAKERLDEIDATLAATESKLSTLKADGQAKVQRALTDMRAQRDAFKQTVNANREAGEAAWRDLRTKLETQWTKFETSFEEWAHATHDEVEHQKAVFTARVDAQIKALNAGADRFKTSAQAFTAARKTEIEEAFKAARMQADAVKAKAQLLRQAGKEARDAITKALAESRAAFDRANKAAHDATGRAA